MNMAKVKRFMVLTLVFYGMAAGPRPVQGADEPWEPTGQETQASMKARTNIMNRPKEIGTYSQSVFENSELAARGRQNPQARCLRYAGSARFQRAGSRSFQLRDARKESFQTGSKAEVPDTLDLAERARLGIKFFTTNISEKNASLSPKEFSK